MTVAEALARVRMIIDEGTAGKWTDNANKNVNS